MDGGPQGSLGQLGRDAGSRPNRCRGRRGKEGARGNAGRERSFPLFSSGKRVPFWVRLIHAGGGGFFGKIVKGGSTPGLFSQTGVQFSFS